MSRVVIVVPITSDVRQLDFDQYRALAVGQESHLLLVDCGSRGQSAHVLELLRQTYGNSVDVLKLSKDQGSAEAVRLGFQRAIRSNPDYVAVWEAELLVPPQYIEKFATVLDQQPILEAVLGSRLPLAGRPYQSCRRHIWQGVRNFLVSAVLGLSLRDTACPARLFRSSPSIEFAFEKPFESEQLWEIELLGRLAQIASRVENRLPQSVFYEYPLDHWKLGTESESHTNHRVKQIGQWVSVCWRYRRAELRSFAA